MVTESTPCRCGWVNLKNELYIRYHDQEWGVPVYDNDNRIFEFLTLESAQAGLSWETVLNKRENYRLAFDGFIPEAVALYNEAKIESLMQNAGIIRNRAKIVAAVNNAQRFLEVQAEFGTFSRYIWQFTDGKVLVNEWRDYRTAPATTPQSDAMAKDLKKRGFKFMGATVCYAHMQAMGMVNDHAVTCFRHAEVRAMAKS